MPETLHPALVALSQEDHDELVKALTDWKEGGNPHPRIPTGHDMDGDGKVDVFMLSKSGGLVVASSADFQEVQEEGDGNG